MGGGPPTHAPLRPHPCLAQRANRTHILTHAHTHTHTHTHTTSPPSFLAFPEGNERDMRFVFCACAVSSMLADWRGVQKGRALAYIRACMVGGSVCT
jgi:hypothetical protein